MQGSGKCPLLFVFDTIALYLHIYFLNLLLSKAQAIHEAAAWMERLAIAAHEESQHCSGDVETQAMLMTSISA